MKESESKQREEVRRKTMPTRRRSVDLAASLLLCTEEGRPCKCSLRLFGAPETHSPSAGDVQSLSSYVSSKGGGGEKITTQCFRTQAWRPASFHPPTPNKYCVRDCVRLETSSALKESSVIPVGPQVQPHATHAATCSKPPSTLKYKMYAHV